MNKVIILLIIIGVIVMGLIMKKGDDALERSENVTKKIVSNNSSEAGAQKVQITSRSILVPYWNIENITNLGNEYDRLVYFGISVNENGVNREDQGFVNIQKFADQSGNIPKLLTVRMLDTDTNISILEDRKSQERIIEDVRMVVEEYGFEGVVLDLELSVIPFTDVKNQINSFTELFHDEMFSYSLDFAVALYGDTYYRGRPYDVKKIGESADEIFIMAYDFHKSRGEPGPNYPFSAKEKYGYDFKTMVSDFSADVQPENLNIIFGMYGYNWTLGKQGKPLKAATAFSLNDAQAMFYPKCNYQSCVVVRDKYSAEMKVTYVDNEGYKNESWFEDEESVEIKSEYLKEKGIGKISYWVNGYF